MSEVTSPIAFKPGNELSAPPSLTGVQHEERNRKVRADTGTNITIKTDASLLCCYIELKMNFDAEVFTAGLLF